MKKLVALTFFVFSTFVYCQTKNASIDGKWVVNFALPDIGQVNTILEFKTKDNTFYAASREDADKILLGNFKAPLARGMSNFKNGSLIRVEKGVYTEENNTVSLKGVLVSSMGNYNFIGTITNNKMDVVLSKRDLKPYGKVLGERKDIKLPMENYSKLFADAMIVTKEKIYNKSLLETEDWKNFVKKMNEIIPDIQDDLEMVSAFFYFGGKLNTSHFALLKSMPDEDLSIKPAKCGLLEEKSATTAYLKIKSFDGEATEMDSIFKFIKSKNYKNLIVDLRNNYGGTVASGMAFANNVFINSVKGGVFLTQKWFNENATIPAFADYNQFETFSSSNYDLIIKGIHNQKGLLLKVNPNANPFGGILYILTNNKTASTCEPLVYELKKLNRATIVGEKTAGAMLNGEKFELYNNFVMYIPTADYYASDGYRIDQNGIRPNVETKSDEALDKVLNELIKD